MKSLRENLEFENLKKVVVGIDRDPQKDSLLAFENTVVLANTETMEALRMSRADRLREIIHSTDFYKQDAKEEFTKGRAKAYKEMGWKISAIAKETGLSYAEIRKL